jgi:hypothetical protein
MNVQIICRVLMHFAKPRKPVFGKILVLTFGMHLAIFELAGISRRNFP